MRRLDRQRINSGIVAFGVGGVLLIMIGVLGSIWWMAALGVVLLGVVAWGLVQLRRRPLG